MIRALEALKRDCDVDLYLDSQYVKQGIESWIHKWKRNGWLTADRKPVKNAELWRELDALVATHRIRWHWVRGHADTPGNHRADELANRGVASLGALPARLAANASAGWRRARLSAASARARSIRRANTVISFSACRSPLRCATSMPLR